nr:shufflon system plasmid conjugative transfer pilus tip adhesin PilV [Trinickia diaoshuihuensis]
MGVAGFATWAKLGVSNVQSAATAGQMLVFDKAAQQYVQENASFLLSVASTNAPYPVPAAQLKPYLPQGFSFINPFGQIWQLQVLQTGSGQLQALVTSRQGRAISDTKQLVQIAAQAGAQGGFVPYPNQAGDTTMNTGNAVGAYGGWSLPLANYGNPGSGHLASLLAFTDSQANNDYLYRVAVPGQPQLNQMKTALDMASNNINNAGNVGASTVTVGNASLSYFAGANQLYVNAPGGTVLADSAGNPQPLYSGAVLANGTINATGAVTSTSPAGGLHGTQTALTQAGLTSDGDIFIQPKGGATLYLDAGGFDNSGKMVSNFNSNEFNGQVIADQYVQINGGATQGLPCGQNFMIGRSDAGTAVFCEYGYWTAAGTITTVAVSSGSWQPSATVSCPAGYTLTGGSCDMFRGGDGREISPRTCAPSGNGYYCNEGNSGTCIAHAICAQ